MQDMPLAGPERAAEGSERKEWEVFRQEINGLERTLGPQTPLPDNPTDEELDKMTEGTRQRVVIANFHELARANEITHKRYSIQQAGNLERGAPFDRESYIASMQAATYWEGMGEIGQFLADSMRNYEFCQDVITTLPAEQAKTLSGRRRMAITFMSGYRAALDERTRFASAGQVVRLLAEEQARPEPRQEIVKQLTAQRDEILPLLSADSRRIVNIPNPNAAQLEAIWTHSNMLERKIIGIASGAERLEGVDQGFVPTTLYLEVLQARYQQIQAVQKGMVERREHLNEGGGRAMAILNRERESVMSGMVAYSNDMVGHQLRMTQMSTMQNLFAGRYGVQNAQPASGPIAPEDRAAINKSVTAMRDFHLQRVGAVVERANTEFRGGVLSREQMRDALIAGTVTAAQVSVWLSRILTLSGNADIGNRIQNFTAGPIVDALGWPRNADGSPKLHLTAEEAAAVMAKLGSLNETVQAFRRTNNSAEITDSLAALRALDPSGAVSATRIGRVRDPLPVGAVTTAQVPARLTELEREYGNREDAVATLHAVLICQLQARWGTLAPDGRGGTGFIGAYATMLTEMERIIGVQLDVAGACFQMAKNMLDLAKYLTVAGVAVALVPAIVGSGALSLSGSALRWTAGTAWRGIQWARGPRVAVPAAAAVPPAQAPLRATPFQRGVWGGAVAVDAYRLYNTYQEVGQANERLDDVKGRISAQLLLAGFVRGEGEVYTHPCGSRVRLNEINQNLDEQRYALYARGGVQAIGLGSLLLMAPRIAMGPAGWALIAVQITVEAGISAWESQAARNLVASPNTPPWLLAALGSSRLVNRSEYDMLLNSSSWNFLYGSTDEVKQTVRDKMYFTIFNQELGSASPDLQREMMAGTRNVSEIDGMYNGDFKNMLLPYLYVRLYQCARARNSGITWDAVKEGRIDRGRVVLPPDVTNLEIRSGMREIGLLYVQHLREKRYVDMLVRRTKLQADVTANPADRQKQAQLADVLHLLRIMGEENVLGAKLSTLTAVHATANAGKTRAQLLMEGIFNQINGAANAPDFRLNAAALAGIAGLPEAITKGGMDFSTNAPVMQYATDDAAQRENMGRIGPLTTDEPEGRVFPAWNDWGGNVRRLLDLPVGRDEAAFVHGTRLVANNISGGARLPAVAGDASSEVARDRITEGAIRIFGADRGRFSADSNLSDHVYAGSAHRPLVFSSLDDGGFAANGRRQRDLCRMLGQPDAGGAPFELRNVRAVFFEGKRLPSGHDVVLATFVYGDLEAMGVRNTRVYVLQQGAGSAATARDEITVRGRSVAYNEAGFRPQSGSQGMLDQTLRSLYEVQRTQRLARHVAEEREAKEKPERDKREKEAKEKEVKDKEAAEKAREERVKRIKGHVEQARKAPNTLVLTETPEGASRYVMFYRDVGVPNGIERTIYLPRYVRPGPAGPAFEAVPSGATLDPPITCQLTISDGTREWTADIPWNFMTSDRVTTQDRRMFTTVLGSATPGRQLEGMDRVIAMMPRNDRMNVAQFRSDLGDIFDTFRDKQIATCYLITLLTHRGGIMNRDLIALYQRHAAMFANASDVNDINRLSRGMTIFAEAGVSVDRSGIYTHNADTARGVSPIHYRYAPGGWQWTPDMENWMYSTQVMVEGGRYNRRSPSGPNCQFINSLPR